MGSCQRCGKLKRSPAAVFNNFPDRSMTIPANIAASSLFARLFTWIKNFKLNQYLNALLNSSRIGISK
jgi:hypothetical protein